MFSYFVKWILGSLFRHERRWRVVCLVSFLRPERGRLLHASANVFLPRTKQKLLLPERASRGLWESQSLGGNKVCVLYIRTQFNILLSYNVFEDCNFKYYNSTMSDILNNQINLAQMMRKFQFAPMRKLFSWVYLYRWIMNFFWCLVSDTRQKRQIYTKFMLYWGWTTVYPLPFLPDESTAAFPRNGVVTVTIIYRVTAFFFFFTNSTLWSLLFMSVCMNCRTLCLIQWLWSSANCTKDQ